MEKILIINGFNFLGKKLIEKLLLDPNINISVTGKKDTIRYDKYFYQEPRVESLDFNLYISKSLLNNNFKKIIYIGIQDNGNNEKLLNQLNNYKEVLVKAVNSNSYLCLINPLNNEREDKKIDYFNSLKILTEEYIQKGLEAEIINIGEIYGPEMDLENENTTIGEIIKHSIKRNTLKLIDKPRYIFHIYIEDAVNSISASIKEKLSGEYNLAEQNDVSLESIALRISNIIDKDLNVKSDASSEDKVKSLHNPLPTTKIETPLEKGLEETYKWMKEEKKLGVKTNSIYNKPNTSPIRNYIPKVELQKEEVQDELNIKDLRKLKEQINKNDGIRLDQKININHSFIKRSLLLVLLLLTLPGLTLLANVLSLYIALQYYPSFSSFIEIETKVTNSIIDYSYPIFYITHKQNTFNNLKSNLVSIQTLNDSNNEYSIYSHSYEDFKNKIIKQIYLQDTLKAMNNNTYAATYSDLQTSRQEIGNNFFITSKNTDFIKKSLDERVRKAKIINKAYSILPTLLLGEKRYVCIILNNSNENSKDIYSSEIISLKDGIYKGTIPLSISKTDKDIENSILSKTNNDGIIFIKKSFMDKQGTTSINTLINSLLQEKISSGKIVSALKDKDISLETTNISIEQNDIINIINN